MQQLQEFHDGYLEGIWAPVGMGQLHLHLSTARRERYTAVLHGVVMVAGNGFREGNIILDVSVLEGAEITHAEIADLYDLELDRPVDAWEQNLFERIQTEAMLLLEISPSYGASLAALAHRFELMPRAAWSRLYCSAESET